ncbi:MAG: tRNA (adenosine(37)-N6)-dimethylallyltransferase MiaA [Muribaculaceae bacterium]|nr:tRNA (adenosine(37)-N6)-dimethylallyltransferase MiaA [Muribaculaceae bacterium]
MERSPLVVITGPTASGKTRRAVDVARAVGAEIISADSRQIYRGMDLGTGKDLDEYDGVPYHLIDIAPAGYKYNLFEYLRDFDLAEADVRSRGHVPLLCGGTGLYVESVLKGLHLPEVPADAELRRELAAFSLEELTAMLASMKNLHNTTDVDTPQRAIRAIEIARFYEAHPEAACAAAPSPRADAVVVGVDIPRDARRARISARLKARFEAGMTGEVEALLASGVAPDDLIYYGLEYKYITLYVTGRISRQEMYSGLETAIHQFAKRQMTWFRGMERRCHAIHWLPYDMPADEFVAEVIRLMKNA